MILYYFVNIACIEAWNLYTVRTKSIQHMNKKNRAAAFAEAKNVIGTISTSKFGVYDDAYTALKQRLLDAGFIGPLATTGEEDHEGALKLWEELYHEGCIVVVLHNKIAREVQNFTWFEHFLRTNDYLGEEFFVWHSDIEEIRRMAEKAGTSCTPA